MDDDRHGRHAQQATPRSSAFSDKMGAPVNEAPPNSERLDSWKAIAQYLQRDLATVRRWEKNLGLPVRRVAGTGRSVFAYTSEIDEWLQTAEPAPAVPVSPLVPVAPAAVTRVHPWRWTAVTAGVLALVTGLFAWPRSITADDLRVELTTDGVVAHDSAGIEQWRHPFPATYSTYLPGVTAEPLQVIGGPSPGVYFVTAYRAQPTEDQVEGGVLTLLDLNGRPQRSLSLDDSVTFAGKPYGAPWALSAFDVSEADGTYRVALTAHHYTWDPGLVTILDADWTRRGTFVHAGWIEQVRWLGPERLLIGGFSNAHDGGMIALLDPAALDGQGPEPPGSPHFCETCGDDRPLRMFVFPRSELNRFTASRFNRTVLQTFPDGHVTARSIEVPSGLDGDADALYEFSASLDLVSARFSERYWEIHRALEAEGKLTHSREQCPDRDGPRQIRMWDAATGWRNLPTR
jgi:hypothetical protein